jgi:diaminopropionate ammonia-lyase
MRALFKDAKQVPDSKMSERSLDWHRRLPAYAVTPLVPAPALSTHLGVSRVLVKDETLRFGLPSFKILGASWATYTLLRDSLGPITGEGALSFDALRAWASPVGPKTLVAATDGNHGRAVARVANWFGLNARIFVPNFVSTERRSAIEAEGAEVIVVDGSYDASVDAALETSEGTDMLLMSDTARTASERTPKRVTEGYLTAFEEVDDQLAVGGETRVDVLGVQAGVGGLAAAATSWARVIRKAAPVRVVVTEPEGSACVLAALAAGEPQTVSATSVTAMAVLQCGTVSLSAFPILNSGVSCCLAVEDRWALEAAKELRFCGVETGPSGAAGLAGLLAACAGELALPVRQHLHLDADSTVVVFATESPAASGKA